MNILSLCDGISCGQVALNRLGISYDNYYASEIDKYAISATQFNYPNTKQIGDIRTVDTSILPQIDILLSGTPCTSFSFAGKRNGMSTKTNVKILTLEQYLELKENNFEFEGQSYLFWEFVRVLKETKPKYFLLENVRMTKEWQDVITNIVGVEPLVINSSLLSAQNRHRIYWTNIPDISIPEDKNIMLKDIIGEYEGIWVYPRGYNPGGLQSYKGKSPTITTSAWEHNFFYVQNGEKKKFTPEICEYLQTLPVGYTKCLSNSKAIKHIGNGWTVDVIAHILRNVVD